MSLLSLPPEILIHVLSFVPPTVRADCFTTCSYLQDISCTPTLWRSLSLKGQGIISPQQLKSILVYAGKNVDSLSLSYKEADQILVGFIENSSNLKQLDLSCNVLLVRPAFEAICGCSQLEELDVGKTWITNKTLERILKCCSSLTSIKLNGCPYLYAPGMLRIFEQNGGSLKHIEMRLAVNNNKYSDEDWLTRLSVLPNLRTIRTPKGNAYQRTAFNSKWQSLKAL